MMAGPADMRKILFVAFRFPPEAGSSGYLRALKFCRNLPRFGWQPVVLAANPRAYERRDDSQLAAVPSDMEVLRPFALDAQRHLSIAGRYPKWFALPDRWVSWCLGAVPAGLRAIRREKIDAILTTFPIASAVLIGLILHRLTGKPWILDLRDSMTEDNYPPDPQTRSVYRWIERQAVRKSSLILFTAPSALRMYRQRYPDLAPDTCVLIPNGYDEEDFKNLSMDSASSNDPQRCIRLLHAGALYPDERNPQPFFKAVSQLKQRGTITSATLRVDLRASGFENAYSQTLRELDIADIVHLLPALPYSLALQDAAHADALLLFQAANCDHQIPAKAYEYLRLRKPILALTTQAGDTGATLKQAGGSSIVDLADSNAIAEALPRFLDLVRRGEHPLPDESVAARYSRTEQARQLAALLSKLLNDKRPSL